MRFKTTVLLGIMLLASSCVHALTLAPYSYEALVKSQAAVALHFRAEWCPTCRAQDKVLSKLMADPGLNILVLAVDYDKERKIQDQLRMRAQSTFIVYRDSIEKGRLTDAIAPEAIRAVLRPALCVR